ncbi:MAG: transporter [Bacteroidales bacterium]|nr:transporter [Bacteroidales bacterium]
MKGLLGFIRDWMLIFAMLSGIAGYFIYVNVPFLEPTHALADKTVRLLQPLLIFAMLFLTFCKVNPKKLRLCPWHGWLLLFQVGIFAVLSAVLVLLPHSGMRVVLEGVMICVICPTATAGAVITKKLGGNAAHLTTYTILINLAVALVVPALVPYVHPNPGMTMWSSSLLILGKVFPLLLLPLLAAMLVRYLAPRLHFALSHYQDLAFYLWAVALALATAVTVRSVMHSGEGLATELWLVAASLGCCLGQFWLGRRVGGRYNDRISAGQSLGQKNTVLAIWMGFTFFTPITAVVGGFYSIWHNLINSWQLYRHKQEKEARETGRP